MPNTDSYDLIVIGSGPAGERGAVEAARLGKRVALIEKADSWGGASVLGGTLPSKTLREAALQLSGWRKRGLAPAIDPQPPQLNIQEFLIRKQQVADSERGRIMAQLQHYQVYRFQGTASFMDPFSVQVDDGNEQCLLTGGHILIATGSRPHHPDLFPFNDRAVFDSDSVLAMEKIPESMAIIGAGVIGIEYACLFRALGVEVHLVHNRDQILHFMDAELSAMLVESLEASGVRLHFNQRVDKFRRKGKVLQLQMDSNRIIECETALVTAGRISNVEMLRLDVAGVKTAERGQIEVNAKGRTSAAHIYAAGDVVGFPALASTSMHQAREAVIDMFTVGGAARPKPVLPFGLYTIPECSMVGATEEELKASGISYVVGRARYHNHARGMMIGEDVGRLKLLFHAGSGRLMGAHLIGDQSTEVIHVAVTAMMMEADIRLFLGTCFNYPTLSEMYQYAAYDALEQFPESLRHCMLDSRAD
ncbi:MAG: Si-specific NAD(P)(+) transhydrogenase [Candidatus Methylacidiphilales bacterium]